MRKSFVLILAVALVAALAVPAIAGPVDLSGFVRIKPYVKNFRSSATTNFITPQANEGTYSFVDERVRLKFTAGDENVKAVTFFELDQYWGDSAYTVGRNLGGGLEADTNNLELKNAYLWFKVPNTSFDVTAGVQNVNDAYAGVFFGLADMAGVFAKGNLAEGVPVRLGWAKFWENQMNEADDVDLYVAEVGFAPTKELNVGASLYFINDLSGGDYGPTGTSTSGGATPRGAVIEQLGNYESLRLYMPGLNASFDAGVAKLSAFLLYQFGTVEDPGGDADFGGYAADLRADFAAGKGKGFVEFLYTSGDDNADDQIDAFLTTSNYNLAASYYSRTDMFLLFPNADDINTSAALAYDVSNDGAGVMALTAGFTMPLTDKVTGKVGLGWLQASEGSDKGMGTEVNAMVNYNIAKGLDLGLVGAYAFLGDMYDAADADDLFDVHGRLNFAF